MLGGESGSQQGQFSQTGGNDLNNFHSSGSNNPPQQQGSDPNKFRSKNT